MFSILRYFLQYSLKGLGNVLIKPFCLSQVGVKTGKVLKCSQNHMCCRFIGFCFLLFCFLLNLLKCFVEKVDQAHITICDPLFNLIQSVFRAGWTSLLLPFKMSKTLLYPPTLFLFSLLSIFIRAKLINWLPFNENLNGELKQ